MPPQLALLLCFGFAYWVYRWEIKNHVGQTKALWLPALWMMRCASRGIDTWLQASSDDSGAGRIDPKFVAVMLALAIFVVVRRPVRWGRVFAHNSAFFIFYAFLVVSVSWADELESPILKVFRPLTDFFMALIVVTEPRPKEAILAVFRRASILMIPLSITLIKYYPYIGRMQSKHWGADNWIGVTTHKNPLGQLCLMSTIAFVCTFAAARREGQPLKQQWVPFTFFAMALYLFYAGGDPDSRSTTSMLCAAVALIFFYVLGRMAKKIHAFMRNLTIAAIALALFFVVLVALDISPKKLIAESQGKDVTLAGRSLIWQESIRLGMQHPVVGSGYGGFWVPSIYDKLDPEIDNGPMQAHNGYIETFVNLGFIGLGLLFVFLLQTTMSSIQLIKVDFDYGRLRLVILLIVLLMNYSEATFPIALHVWWFGFLLVAIYAEPWTTWPRPTTTTENTDPIEVENVEDSIA